MQSPLMVWLHKFSTAKRVNQIFVLDIFGKVIVEKKVTSNKVTIQTDNWSEGIYLISLNDNSGNRHVFKMFKTK